jgi:putative lipoic acid-binding regulatory protein
LEVFLLSTHQSSNCAAGVNPMTRLPSVELLEAHHRFPGPYMFKVIGKSDNGFIARTVAAVRDELAAPIDPPYSVRETPGGRHVSVTLEVSVASAQQVLAVYRRIIRLTGLVILW